MQINPKKIIEEGVLTPASHTEVQQNGIDCTVAEGIIIPPKGFINVFLQETVNIPSNYFMTFHHRSSFSRKGVFITSGVYDSGFCGSMGCSIYNMSDEAVHIPINTRVGQAVFWEANPASLYNGQYQHDFAKD